MKNFWDYIIYKQKKKSLKSALSTCWHVCRPNPLKMKDREKNLEDSNKVKHSLAV